MQVKTQTAKNFRELSRWSAVFSAAAFSGCTLFSGVAGLPPGTESINNETRLEEDYTEYRGVIHVHTDYSHDSIGTLNGVVRAALRNNLDYVAVTDHNTLEGRLHTGAEQDGPQIFWGSELTTLAGHYLVFGVDEWPDLETSSAESVIRSIQAAGGVGFVAHPFKSGIGWHDWTIQEIPGMEIYNLNANISAVPLPEFILKSLFLSPRMFFTSNLPKRSPSLNQWDALNKNGKQVRGIGSVDAHEYSLLGWKLFSYDRIFPLVQTHVLIEGPLTEGAWIDALSKGHAFIAHGFLGDATGFFWGAERGGKTHALMGDRVTCDDSTRLRYRLPEAAEVRLIVNGEVRESEEAQSGSFECGSRGAYRIEAWRRRRPWIYSNPIYVD